MSAATPYVLPMQQRDIVCVDLETSSLDPVRGEILELAAARVSADLRVQRGVVNRLCELQYPEHAEPEALRINGYDPTIWKRNASPVRVALVELEALVGADDVVFLGQNPSFDWNFLRAAFARARLTLPKHKYLIDTASMAWPLAMKRGLDRIGLDALCTYYGIPNNDSHRAMSDVRRCLAVYAKMLALQPAPGIVAA